MSFQEFPENNDNKVIRLDVIPENSSREKLCDFYHNRKSRIASLLMSFQEFSEFKENTVIRLVINVKLETKS